MRGTVILGVEFYPLTLKGALNAIDWMLERDDGITRLVVTANPIMLCQSLRDPEFRALLEEADLITPDGQGILWAARKLGGFLPERVTGIDLAHALFRHRPDAGYFFLGGKPGVAEKAAERVRSQNPAVKILGTHHGYFRPEEEERVVSRIRESGARVLFACMGSPAQEKFISRNSRRLGARVGIGLGGVLDVLAGKVPRAPEKFQRLGIEWLYRLIREPRRLPKDLLLLEFVLRVLRASKDSRKVRGKVGEE
ncbi:MAG: WecB/TagA/CpsF family glycosyltransferase [Firmicutes bacterium]|nr:WecB/TagA/CpsF family glycosyltransferase [Candidatus Fermentithermobacillaceae bacterium]